MYVCVLIRVYLYVCMHVYNYMCIYMCSMYMFMRRVCIHTRIPYFSELRFYVVYNIENRPFLGRGLLVLIMHIYECFIAIYMLFGIRIVLMYFTGHMEYVLFYWSLHDMLKMYCLHAFFVVFYLLVLGQKWPNKYVQTKYINVDLKL